MFENLSDKLQRAFKNLRGQGTLSEENIGEAMREIRLALLEADVNVKVVKQFTEQVRAKALGAEVMTALSPAEQVVKIVRDELIEILGKDTAKLKFSSQPPSVVLMAGLQGSGKTTTSGKLAAGARGGAALSIRSVTGQPIKFIGVGEKYDALEPFHPDRIVGRILGMGDILSLIERAEERMDKKKSEEFAKKALSGDGFSLEDFRDQLRQVKKLGSLQSVVKMLPNIGPFQGMQAAADKVDEKELARVEAIINSMTPYEREHHDVINGSRRKRIARGSGTSVQQVNQLLRQYAQMRKMFRSMSKSGFMQKRLAGMKLPGM